MRIRNRKVTVRLSEKERESLKAYVAASGLTQESYLRHLIMNRIPKEAPPLDYYNVLKELHAIGTNINQIAKVANTSGDVNAAFFATEAAKLRAALLAIQRAVELPEKNDGDYKN